MANSSSLPLGWLLVCLGAAPAYGDAIYTCAGKDGTEVLQNWPCEPGSEARAQQNAPDAKSTAASTDAATGTAPAADAASNGATVANEREAQDARSVASDTAPANIDAPVNASSEPVIGMTQQEVRAVLGEPTAITQEEVVEGRETTWTYGDRVLQFDTSGRLTKK